MKLLLLAAILATVGCSRTCEVRIMQNCGQTLYKADFKGGSNIFKEQEDANARCNEFLKQK